MRFRSELCTDACERMPQVWPSRLCRSVTTRQSPFGDRPFTVSGGAANGLGRGAMAGPRFERPFYGVRRWVDPKSAVDASGGGSKYPQRGDGARIASPSQLEVVRRKCEAFAVLLRPGRFYSHDTMLALAGAPMPRGWRAVVHVSAYRPMQPPRVSGVVGHRLQSRTPALWKCGDLPIEHPARAWVQASREWEADDLIAAADFLVLARRKLVTLDELRAEARWARGSALDDVLAQVRQGSESPEETRLRLALVRARLPEPALNRNLYTESGKFVARLDQSYPEYRVAVEYDGRQHAVDAAQFARDADRWDAIRTEGWYLVRVLQHHMRDGAVPAVAKVSAALHRAGWPGLL